MAKSLVVEDDLAVTDFLKEQNDEVTSVSHGEIALDKLVKQIDDLLLLTLENAYTQLIRFNHLISKAIAHPFSLAIVMKRFGNVLRANQVEQIIRMNHYIIHLEVMYKAVQVVRPKKESDILVVLAKKQGNVVTKEQLVYKIWGYEDDRDSLLLFNSIKNLQKKLLYLLIKTVNSMSDKIEVWT